MAYRWIRAFRSIAVGATRLVAVAAMTFLVEWERGVREGGASDRGVREGREPEPCPRRVPKPCGAGATGLRGARPALPVQLTGQGLR
ncbi:hypothetical protein GCM10010307_55640 [Streptomyces vastus]|uniref:Secreted protein n=1 Tax=Streptomyces vastus TaxID=285451 RepID=A0ABN3RB75_9ACTN